jgi:hypothetical protein
MCISILPSVDWMMTGSSVRIAFLNYQNEGIIDLQLPWRRHETCHEKRKAKSGTETEQNRVHSIESNMEKLSVDRRNSLTHQKSYLTAHHIFFDIS